MRHLLCGLAAVAFMAAACSRSGVAAPSATGGSPITAPTASPCASARSAAPGQSVHAVTVASVSRSWVEYVPKAYDGATARPVVVTLHGLGSNGAQQLAYSGWNTVADREDVIVLSPNAVGGPGRWDLLGTRKANADIDFVGAMLTDVAERLCIASRISLNGISNGSAFAAILACALGDRVRAVAFVATTFQPRDCGRTSPVTVVAFHGTDDKIVPYEGGRSQVLPIVVPAVESAIVDWAYTDGCATKPTDQQLSAEVRKRSFAGCHGGTTVELYTIAGGGHTWPGGPASDTLGRTTTEINATDVMWKAFART
jgi:polyhydroxybutyrate depolymerase